RTQVPTEIRTVGFHDPSLRERPRSFFPVRVAPLPLFAPPATLKKLLPSFFVRCLRSELVVLLVESETGRWSRILRTRIWGQVNTWYLLNPAMGQASLPASKKRPSTEALHGESLTARLRPA